MLMYSKKTDSDKQNKVYQKKCRRMELGITNFSYEVTFQWYQERKKVTDDG